MAERGQLARDYLWNTLASLTASASTVVMLAAVTHTAGLAAGGLFSIATAVGQQLQTVGMFEVRTFHITDVRRSFSFGTYMALRLVTTAVMVAGIVIYSLVKPRPDGGTLAVALVAALSMFDAFEDVYYCELQRCGRLDLGGRARFIRLLATTLSFCVALLVTSDLLVSAAVSVVVSAVALVAAFLPPSRRLFEVRPVWRWNAMARLALACLPLFAAAFVSMWLANSPKYAIERYLTDDAQGVFAIIAMPAMAINLLAQFVYRPLVTRLAAQWVAEDYPGFLGGIGKGLAGTAVAFVAVEAVCIAVGIPLLSLVFGQDVSGNLGALTLLVGAGALNAAGVVLYYALATMRLQRLVLVAYVLAAGVGLLSQALLVPAAGLAGACVAYLVTMAALVALLSGALAWHVLPVLRPRPEDAARTKEQV